MADSPFDYEIRSNMDLILHVAGTIKDPKYNFFNNLNPITTAEGKTEEQKAGATLYKIKNGTRQPMNVTTNNPSLIRPTVAGMQYFGQSPIAKYAMDQIINRVVGVFPTGAHGAGGNAFHFLNSPVFSGAQSVQSIMQNLIGGIGAADNALLSTAISTAASGIASVLGASPLSTIDLTKTDQMIQLLSGASAYFSQASKSPFTNDVLNTGVQYAQTVTAYVNKLKGTTS